MNPESLTIKCYYRTAGVRCEDGMLFHADNGEPATLEGTGVCCPACEGKGTLLTDKGRDLLQFLTKFARPVLHDIVEELFEERER